MEKFLRTFLTYADRAQELGLKPDVGLFLSEYCKGGWRWRRKVSEYDKRKIAELRDTDYSDYKISKILGISQSSIRYHMRKEARV